MNLALKKAWSYIIGPVLQRPKRLQVAALCHRQRSGAREFLLVTSRDTKRWIIPKGWPIRGLESHETALREAWEEAGVKAGNANKCPEGTYTYQKRLETGWSFPVETIVYSVSVNELSEDYPEAGDRTRKWVSAEAAADMVDEPELKRIFGSQAS